MTTDDAEPRMGECDDCPDDEAAYLCSLGGRDAVFCPREFGPPQRRVSVATVDRFTAAERRQKIVTIKPTSYVLNFILTTAATFVVDRNEDERDALYIDGVRNASEEIRKGYSAVSAMLGSSHQAVSVMKDLMKYSFLIGLVSDRNGLSKGEVEKMLRADLSMKANNVKWSEKEPLRQKLIPIVRDIVLSRKNDGIKQIGVDTKAVRNFRLNDPEFSRRISEIGIQATDIADNMLLELFRAAKLEFGCLRVKN